MSQADDHAEILQQVEKLWSLFPDWRFGQLVSNVASLSSESSTNIKDETFQENLSRLLEMEY